MPAQTLTLHVRRIEQAREYYCCRAWRASTATITHLVREHEMPRETARALRLHATWAYHQGLLGRSVPSLAPSAMRSGATACRPTETPWGVATIPEFLAAHARCCDCLTERGHPGCSKKR